MNVFEQFNQKKEAQRALIKQAADNGFITDEQRREFEQKLDNDVLTIGVIGQMKAGKSTFLNAFVFERDVLPAATTPMTAALTVITYGSEERIEVEFYTREEWDEQRLTAQRELTPDSSEAEKSKVQAAQELVEKATRISSRLPELLGTKHTDTLDKLIEYVGVDGQFVSITKSVKIYYPKEYLKGVEIVDTPGFNDPIVSREERTKDFLRRADAVLLMLYAGRPFDATDREIVFKHLSQCGIGKVVIGINKYDTVLEKGKDVEDVKGYVADQIKKACKASSDESLKAMLNNEEPIPLSAEMALLSYLPTNTILSNDSYKHAWDRYGSVFGLGSQADLRKESRFGNLAKRVQEIVMKEKEEILFNKSHNAIKAAVSKVGLDLDQEMIRIKEQIANLSLPEEELEEKERNLRKAKRRLKRQTEDYLYSTREELAAKRSNASDAFDSLNDKCYNDATKVVREAGEKETSKAIWEKVFNLLYDLEERGLKRVLKRLREEKKNAIVNKAGSYLTEVTEILHKYMDVEEGNSILTELKKLSDIEQLDVFMENREEKKAWENLRAYTDTQKTFRPIFFETNRIIKEKINKTLFEYRHELPIKLKLDEQLDAIMNIDSLEDRIQKLMFENFLNPIEADLKQIIENREGREKQRADAAAKLDSLQKQKQEYDAKVATMAL